MENKKMMYLCKSRFNDLNEYEKKHGKISYKTLLNYYNRDMILCNNIVNIDDSIYDNILVGNIYNEEEDYYNDIFQYFIWDLTEWDLKHIQENYNDELIIAYSEILDNYVLLVDHYGTSWDYVLTNIEYTDNWEKYKEWEKQHEN